MPNFKMYNVNVIPGTIRFQDCEQPFFVSKGFAWWSTEELKQESVRKYLSKSYTELTCTDDWMKNIPENAYISKITTVFPTHQHIKLADKYVGIITSKKDSVNNTDFEIDKSDNLRISLTSEMGIKEFKGSVFINLKAKNANINTNAFGGGTTQHPDDYDYRYDSGEKRYCFFDYTIENEFYWYYTDGDNRPYFEFEYEFKPPEKPGSLVPNGDILNPRGEILFSWNTKTSQQAFELRYKTDNSSWNTVTQNTATRSYTLPENKISDKEGTINWEVRVKDLSGKWSDWSTSSFVLGVLPQEPPILISPKGDYVKSGEPIAFEWSFVANSSEKQKKYELQYSFNNETWKTVSKNTNESKYILEDTKGLISSIGRWRIKVTNTFDEVSEYSDIATFQVIGAPTPAQIISVTDNNYPTIKWQAKEQESYYLDIRDKEDKLIYESGLKVSYEKSLRVPKFLIPGKYVISLSIINMFGIPSEITEYTFVITEKDIKQPSIALFKSNYYTKIISDSANGTVIRDDKEIGKLEDGEFFDYSIGNNKIYKYKVLNINQDNGSYSEIKSIKTSFSSNTIAKLNKLDDYIILKWNLDNAPERQSSYDFEKSEMQIVGREYPLIEYGEYKKEVYNYQFVVDEYELERLINIVYHKGEILFRDYFGKVIVGDITDFSKSKLKINKYQISFKITKTSDYYE